MNEIQETKRIDALYDKIAELIEQARKHVATTVNLTEVYTKYHIGQYIVEDEQQASTEHNMASKYWRTCLSAWRNDLETDGRTRPWRILGNSTWYIQKG